VCELKSAVEQAAVFEINPGGKGAAPANLTLRGWKADLPLRVMLDGHPNRGGFICAANSSHQNV